MYRSIQEYIGVEGILRLCRGLEEYVGVQWSISFKR